MTHSQDLAEQAMAQLQETLRQFDTRFAELELELDNEKAERLQADEKLAALQQQLAGIEQELCEEKNRAENLVELANERREEIRRVTEQFEEAHERYEDANWKLGKAMHFERLVLRRKKLIGNLIKTIRAKQKANTALKAGIDGLRTYKAAAEGKQQELLARIEKLESSLSEAQEKLERSSKRAADSDELSQSQSEVGRLKSEIEARENSIKGLREELKQARILQAENAVKASEIERLKDNITSKNAAIAELSSTADELERSRAKLREREDEVLHLMSSAEADRQTIEHLKEQVGKLESMLAERASGGPARDPASAEKHKEQEEAIERLGHTIREYESTIATLSDAVEHWKRKYDFLAADTPYDYDSAAGS